MLEYIIVGLIVLSAVIILVYKFFKTSDNKDGKCGCCSNCSYSDKL
ncbi:MAG TPA: FeoB-associated Cys-rich membrane protein [bacterium]|nr:FeoB-associated Cys-rich membrane protein [bacterium]